MSQKININKLKNSDEFALQKIADKVRNITTKISNNPHLAPITINTNGIWFPVVEETKSGKYFDSDLKVSGYPIIATVDSDSYPVSLKQEWPFYWKKLSTNKVYYGTHIEHTRVLHKINDSDKDSDYTHKRKAIVHETLSNVNNNLHFTNHKRWFTDNGYQGQKCNIEIPNTIPETAIIHTSLSPMADIVISKDSTNNFVKITNFSKRFGKPRYGWDIKKLKDSDTFYEHTIKQFDWNTNPVHVDYYKPVDSDSKYILQSNKNPVIVYPASKNKPCMVVADTQWTTKYLNNYRQDMITLAKMYNYNKAFHGDFKKFITKHSRALPVRQPIALYVEFEGGEYEHLVISSLISSLWSAYDDYDNDDILMHLLATGTIYKNHKGQHVVKVLPSQIFNQQHENITLSNTIIPVEKTAFSGAWDISLSDVTGKPITNNRVDLKHDNNVKIELYNYLKQGWLGQNCTVSYSNTDKMPTQYAPSAKYKKINSSFNTKHVFINNDNNSNVIVVSADTDGTVKITTHDSDSKTATFKVAIDNVTIDEKINICVGVIACIWSKFDLVSAKKICSLISTQFFKQPYKNATHHTLNASRIVSNL